MRAAVLAAVAAAVLIPNLCRAQNPTLVPATLRSVTPSGVPRGSSVTLRLDGINIQRATRAIFDDPAITGVPEPGSGANQALVKATIGAGARVGIHRVYLHTPLGTTAPVTFAVGAWPERAEKEPNDAPETAAVADLPATFLGKMDRIGDEDCFRFRARAGDELVFEVVASAIRSRLSSVLTLLDPSGKILSESRHPDGRTDSLLGHRFAADGIYTIRIRDFENASGGDVHYRLNAAAVPYATHVFPLGLRKGEGEVTLGGLNLGEAKVRAASDRSGWGAAVTVDRTAAGFLLHPVRLAVGEEPEVFEADRPNDTAAAAQEVPAPVTINGRIAGPGAGGEGDADCYRFRARKGETRVLEVQARRFGSLLDPVIEVLDPSGKRIERAALRCVAETALTLRDHDSAAAGLRLLAWNDLAINDFLYVRGEVIQIVELPRGPDSDVRFRSFRGQRTAFLDTTPSAHAINTPVYKVQVHPPGTRFPPNGMPVFRLYYRNDDGGPLYGKDSRLTFTAPADGEYVVRITDVRGQGSDRHAYRLTIREPRPDFRLAMNPEHPNVPAGASVPVTVSVERIDGFDGPVEVRLEGLPEGVRATPATIQAGEIDAALLLTADAAAKTPASDGPSPVRLVGSASVQGREIVRVLEPVDGHRFVTVLPRADLTVAAKQRKVTISPGTEQYLEVSITRENGFEGRVPVEVRNLPFGVRILDVGLNGVLITEQETARRFAIVCEPWVRPMQRRIYPTVRTETSSAAPTEIGTEVLLEVAPGPERPAARGE